jgi:hypothetical protein
MIVHCFRVLSCCRGYRCSSLVFHSFYFSHGVSGCDLLSAIILVYCFIVFLNFRVLFYQLPWFQGAVYLSFRFRAFSSHGIWTLLSCHSFGDSIEYCTVQVDRYLGLEEASAQKV